MYSFASMSLKSCARRSALALRSSMPARAARSTCARSRPKPADNMEHARREVVWSLTAQQDLIDIWRHFAHVASSATADRLVDEIEAAANRLVIDPRMHRVRRDLIPNLPGELRSVPAHPYTLFYRTNPQSADGREEIEILRVLHERRDFSPELPSTG